MEKIIRPLYPVTTVDFGGVETFIRQTALFHDPNKIKPIYCFLKKGPLQEWMQKETDHETHVCPFPIRFRKPLSVLQSILWLKHHAKKSSADLIHSSMAYTSIMGSLAAKQANIPHVWFQHGPVSGWMDQLAGLLPADLVFYNSKYTLESQNSKMGKLTLIQNLIHPHLQHEVLYLGATSLLPDQTKHPAKIHIGMLCRFQRWKGVDLFIRAVRLARERVTNIDFEVTIWGDAVPGQEDAEHVREIELLCKTHSINRLPQTSNPEQAMQTLDILVNASITPEPFGLTIVEAMHAGVVPIAPRFGGPFEIIDEDQTGLLFQPGDPADLASKILELVENPAKRSKLAKRAREVGQQKFSAVKSIRQLEEAYFKLLRIR